MEIVDNLVSPLLLINLMTCRSCSPTPGRDKTTQGRGIKFAFHGCAGFTLVEVMVATIVIVTFFAAIFEVNAVCLRLIDAGKESLAAVQSVQDRAEALRNLAFSDLTSASYVANLMSTPPNAASIASKATEVVTISKYPSPASSEINRFTRGPDGTVTTNAAGNPGSTLVTVDVQLSWTMTLGGRSRTEQTSTIVSNGTKK